MLVANLFAQLLTCGCVVLWIVDSLHHLRHMSRDWLQFRNPGQIWVEGSHMSSQEAHAIRTEMTQQQFSLTLNKQHSLA